MPVAVDAQPVVGRVTREGHLTFVGAAVVIVIVVVVVFEPADFGFEFALFFLLGLEKIGISNNFRNVD